MSNMSDQTKQELMAHSGVGGGVGGAANNGSGPVQINHTIPISENIRSNGGSTTSRSKPQGCKICGKMLSSASSYYVHMKLHSGTKPYRCGVCEAAFCRKPYLEVHMRTHTGERPFQCSLCLKRFSQKSSLNTHKRIHTGN